jgi:hypothetical protein
MGPGETPRHPSPGSTALQTRTGIRSARRSRPRRHQGGPPMGETKPDVRWRA